MKPLETFLLLVKVSRPVLWLIPALMFLAGILFAGAKLSIIPVIQLFMLTLPYNLFLYGINDAYDYKSDMKNPRKGNIQGPRLKKENHRQIYWYLILAAFLLLAVSFMAKNFGNLAGTALLLAASYLYSAPPLRLKVHPPFDSLMNGLIYVIAPFAMGFSFNGSLFDMPSKMYLIAIGGAGVHAYSTIADYTADKAAGDNTFAVVFGKRAAAAFGFCLVMITLFFAGIGTWFINVFVIACAAATLLSFLYPSEKLTKVSSYTLVILFFISLIVFLAINSI